MLGSLGEYLLHEYIKLSQATAAKNMIDNAVNPDSTRAVICCDFAEKFKCVNQNAPQSAHYGQTQVSLFTVGVYFKGFQSFTIASDMEKSTKDCVLSYLDVIIEKLIESDINDDLTGIDVWSDNATSQFKNQYIMEGMKSFQERYSTRIRWNFYAAMHGKSIVDGIGGCVKRYVRSKVMSQQVLVKSAEDFVREAQGMKVNVILMKISEIKARNNLIGLEAIVKKSKQIPNIKKSHFFEVQNVKVGKASVLKVIAKEITP